MFNYFFFINVYKSNFFGTKDEIIKLEALQRWKKKTLRSQISSLGRLIFLNDQKVFLITSAPEKKCKWRRVHKNVKLSNKNYIFNLARIAGVCLNIQEGLEKI